MARRMGRVGIGRAPLIAGLALTCTVAWAHPGPGIVVDKDGVIYVAGGPRNRIFAIREGKGAHPLVEEHTEYVRVPHHLLLHDGFVYTASDDGKVLWQRPTEVRGRTTHLGGLVRYYPAPDWYGITFVGRGGNPFTIDKRGNIYCINERQYKYSQILKIDAGRKISVVAGGEWGYVDGKGKEAKFEDLHSAAFAWGPKGGLYLTDNRCRVRRIAKDGTVTTVAGGSERGYKDGPAKEARFDGASGLCVDDQGAVYVADRLNQRIRKIANGKVTTVTGWAEKDGKGAPLASPTGVTLGPKGALYILDYVKDVPTVRKLAEGRLTTIAEIPKEIPREKKR